MVKFILGLVFVAFYFYEVIWWIFLAGVAVVVSTCGYKLAQVGGKMVKDGRKWKGFLVIYLGGMICAAGFIGGVWYVGTAIDEYGESKRIARYEEKNSCDDDHDKARAWVEAENAVSIRLKAPSQASFESYSPKRVTHSGCEYVVQGYVDAPNSFNAMLRQNFTVITVKSGGSWRIKEVKLRD